MKTDVQSGTQSSTLPLSKVVVGISPKPAVGAPIVIWRANVKVFGGSKTLWIHDFVVAGYLTDNHDEFSNKIYRFFNAQGLFVKEVEFLTKTSASDNGCMVIET